VAKLSGSTYEPYGLTAMSPLARDRGLFVGMMGLEDDARVDFARLRAARRARVFSGMKATISTP